MCADSYFASVKAVDVRTADNCDDLLRHISVDNSTVCSVVAG